MRLTFSELSLQRTSLIAWTLAIAAFVALVVAVYPSIAGDDSLDAIYEGLPPAAQQLLGGSDATSPVGYLNTQLYAFLLPAVLLVFAFGRSAATIAGEEEQRTLDLLLAQPLARWLAYIEKAVAVAIGLFVLSVASLIPLRVLNSSAGLDIAVGNLIGQTTQMFLFCLALGMWTMAISSATGKRGLGLAVVIGYTVASYLIYGLAGTVSWLENIVPATPWRWYAENQPLQNGLGVEECLVLLAATVVGALIGMWFFNRRDLHA